MAQPATPSAAADVFIETDAEAVYALLTDLDVLATLAAETTAMNWDRAKGARPGAVFRGTNRNGARFWTTTCTVTDAAPGKTFGFDVKYMVIPISHWRYEITPVPGGCRVEESTWDRRPGWFRRVAVFATGVADRTTANSEHIELTLQRLKERAEG